MSNESKKYLTTEWQPISDLTPVKEDISEYGYSAEYIEANKLKDKKDFHCSSSITGRVNYHEHLEVKQKGNTVLFRENDNYEYTDSPEKFYTQHGLFINHNNGEFSSWLETENGFELNGNFCDMFDCGEYSYAVSNLMHLGLGHLKIVKIKANLQYEILYDTYTFESWHCLEYIGYFRNDRGAVIIASGFTEAETEQNEERNFQNKTLLFQISKNGDFGIIKEWNFSISSPNSMVKKENFLYFGQNKMVTRLDLSNGEISYYTNKSAEELASLGELW